METIVKVIGTIIGIFVMAGLIVGLFTTGIGLVMTVLVTAFKVGLVLAPIVVIIALIRSIFIW